MTFEEGFAAAEKAVSSLEQGDLSLEESLRTYEEGLRALKACYGILQKAERRIEVLAEDLREVSEGAEGITWKPATSSGTLRGALECVEREGDAFPDTPPGGASGGGQRTVKDGRPSDSSPSNSTGATNA